MRVLDVNEVEDIISRTKGIPDSTMEAILDELEEEHPGIYRLIYGEPSDAIAASNKDMANLYLDLSFDVIWVFNEEFGPPPDVDDEERWTLSKISLIDAEMKSLTDEVPMSIKFRRKLQKRFVKTSFGSDIQLGLLQYLADEVRKYVSFKKKRTVASQLTNNLLFVLVRLMGELYSLNPDKSA